MSLALIIVSILLLISEGLGMSPNIKANSIFEAIVNILKALKDALTPKP